jgi:hypothetical protein
MSKQNNKGLQRFRFWQFKNSRGVYRTLYTDNDKFLELFVWLQDKTNEALKRRSQKMER